MKLPATALVVPPPTPASGSWLRPEPSPMAAPTLTPRELVDRLDARHDELVTRLDELHAQIEAALVEFGRPREAGIVSEQGGSAKAA